MPEIPNFSFSLSLKGVQAEARRIEGGFDGSVVGLLVECAHRRWLLRTFSIAKRSFSVRFYIREMISTVILIVVGGVVEKTRK